MSDWSSVNSHSLIIKCDVFSMSDVSKALILTEIGAKRDPATLDIFLGNMKKLLSAPTHGYVRKTPV